MYIDRNFQARKDDLRSQIEEQYGKLTYTYTTHIKQAHLLSKLDSRLKWTDIALTAISTCGVVATICTNEKLLGILSAILSACSLAITLYTKEARLGELSLEHKAFSAKLWPLREDYISLLTELPMLEDTQIIARRNEYKERLAEYYQNEPITNSRSYRLAQKALKSEEEQFFSREELNQILPSHLRHS